MRGAKHSALLLALATALFAFLFTMAWRYYLERTALADSAFFTFLMLDGQHPVSALGRIGSWLPQLLPLLLSRLGAPLALVLRSYSIAFVLFHALVFWLIEFRLKDRIAALVQLFTLCAGFHYTFYYGISELYQGLSLTILAWALLKRWMSATDRAEARRFAVLALLLNVWASCYHQLLVFPMLAFIGVEAGDRNILRRARFRWAVLGIIGWYAVRIRFLSSSAYEQERTPSIAEMAHWLPHLGQLGSTIWFKDRWTLYKALWLLLVGDIFVWCGSRRWMEAAFTIGLSVLFITLMLTIDRDGSSPMLFENYVPVLGLMLALPFARYVFTQVPKTRMFRSCAVGSTLVVLLGSAQIQRGHYLPSAHVAWAQRTTRELRARGIGKGILHADNFPWSYAWGQWPCAFETALISGIDGPRAAVSVFATRDSVLPVPPTNQRYVFYGPDWSPLWFTTNHFDRRYFKFAPGAYRRVNSAGRDTIAEHRLVRSVVLRPLLAEVRMAPDRFTVAEVELTDPGADTLRSLLTNGEPLRLVYRLIDRTGRSYPGTDERTALELDVPPGASIITGIAFARPVDSGEYVAEIGLADGPGPWKVKARMKLIVGRFGY